MTELVDHHGRPCPDKHLVIDQQYASKPAMRISTHGNILSPLAMGDKAKNINLIFALRIMPADVLAK